MHLDNKRKGRYFHRPPLLLDAVEHLSGYLQPVPDHYFASAFDFDNLDFRSDDLDVVQQLDSASHCQMYCRVSFFVAELMPLANHLCLIYSYRLWDPHHRP